MVHITFLLDSAELDTGEGVTKQKQCLQMNGLDNSIKDGYD